MNSRKGQDVGYIRVSSVDQNLERQLVDTELDDVYEDKVSAKDINRPGLQQCLRYLRKGDTLHVHSIDRLARNLHDLERMIDDLTARGVQVKFHKESLTFSGDDSPIAKLQLQIIGAVAGFERALIRERQREGIAARKAKGLPVGAKPKLTEEQIAEIRRRVASGEQKKALAIEYGVSRGTIYNALQ